MKRNLDHVLLMPDRKTPMTHGNSQDPLTVGIMISEAAIGMYPHEQPLADAKEKALRFKLSVRCGLGGVQSFTGQEMEAILRVSHLKCGTWLYGQIEAWSEGKDPFTVEAVTEEPNEAQQAA